MFEGDTLWDLIMERITNDNSAWKLFREFMKKHAKRHMGVDGFSSIKVICHFSTIGYDFTIRCSKCNEEQELEMWKNW